MKRAVLILSLMVAGLIGGCASSPRGESAARPKPSVTIDDALKATASEPDALARLQQLAKYETDGTAAWTAPQSVPVPAGIDPQALMSQADTPRVHRALDDVINELRAAEINDDATGGFSGPPPTEAERAEAQAAYEKGSAALEARQFYVAVIELEKAHRLNPTDPDIMEGLARTSRSAGNRTRAMDLYRQLFAVVPTRGSVAVELAGEAIDRRAFAESAAILSRAWTAIGADVALDYMLGVALQNLRYLVAAEPLLLSAAGIDSAQVETDDPNSITARIYRQRGELWRMIGDLRCRLGRFDDAIDAYDVAADLPLTDPGSLRPRQMFAHLSRGAVFSAELVVAESITADALQDVNRTAGEIAYLRQHAQPIEPLANALLQQYVAQPRNADLLRVLSRVLPAAQASELYQTHLENHPEDTAAVIDLIAGRAGQDIGAAVDLAVEVSTKRPELITAIVPRLRESATELNALIEAINERNTSPAAARLYAALLANLAATGRAWDVVADARTRWPDDSALAVQQLMLAASLGETMLARRLIDELPTALTPMEQVAVAGASQMVGDSEEATRRAEAAVEAAGDDATVEVLSTAAAVHLAVAQTALADYQRQNGGRAPLGVADVEGDISRSALHAANLAYRVLEMDPANQASLGVLVSLYAPTGVSSNAERYTELLATMRTTDPDAALYARLEAEQAVRRRRHEFAIERMTSLLQSQPDDAQALEILMLAWRGKGDSVPAMRWLEAQLQTRPDDANVLRYWAEMSIARGETDLVLDRLNALHERQPQNQQNANLLEQVHRSQNNQELATEFAVRRLMARPQAAARELELAAVYAGAAMDTDSIDHITWLIDNAAEATPRQLAEAVTVATRLNQTDVIERDQTVLRLVDAAILRDPAIPLQTYGQGLLAVARLVDFGENVGGAADEDRFETFVRIAARSATGASGTSVGAALQWREMAQAMIDTDEMAAASKALRIRLDRGIEANRAIRAAERTGPAEERDPGLDQDALMVLVRCVIILDAALNDPEHTIALLERLDRHGQLVPLPGMEVNVRLDEALYTAGGLNTVLGNDHGSEVIMRRLVELAPNHSMGLNNLGYQRIEENHDDAESVLWVQRAYQLAPQVDNILDTYGWLKYKQGVFDGDDGAVALVQRSVDASAEPGVEVLDHLGDALWRAGRKEDARAAWRRLEAYIDRNGFDQYIIQTYQNFQVGPQSWLLLVLDPAEIYERDYGALLRRARMKLRTAEEGGEPVLAPTFDEAHGRNEN